MKSRRRTLIAFACLAVGLAAGGLWLASSRGPGPGRGGEAAAGISFSDVTEAAGIRFQHESGARGRLLNPETFGPGAGWLDADGDARPDLLLINGNALEGEPDPRATPVLYRNLGAGRFEDATERAGLSIPLYGMGFAAADLEGDGDEDLLIYGLHRSVLLVNDGAGRFTDRTAGSGLEVLRGWVCAAAFFDYDRDGRLDLFAGNYVVWTPASENGIDCTFGTPHKKYCPVAVFPPSAPQLFRGRGDGTFEERTAAAGLAGLRGKALGVVVEDWDRDGDPDLFVANDSVPNFLLENRGDGTFADRGLESGFALDPGGTALAGMGIDADWETPAGPLRVAVGNFSGEPTTLHVQEAGGTFAERSYQAGIGRASIDRVTFGLLLEDFDLDGRTDLLQVNGHVFDVEALSRVPYRQRAQLFLGKEGGRFEALPQSDRTSFFERPILGRSLAAADYDGDGDLDLVVTENQGKAILLRNDLPSGRRSVRFDLRATRGHREAIGAEVVLRLEGPAGPRAARRTRKSASSYLSQSERVLTFGLRDGEEPAAAEVAWPSGGREVFRSLAAGRRQLLVEGEGSPLAPGDGGASPASGAAGAGGPRPGAVAARRQGVELLAAGRAAEAAAALEQAVRADPDDLVSLRALLSALERTGRSADSDARVADIVRRHPDPHLLLSAFAVLLREEGDVRLAVRFFEEALRLDPKRLDAMLALGNLAFDRGAHEDALRAYARALEIAPDSLEALTNTGQIHAIRKDYPRAATFLERALALKPEHAPALSTLGGILIEKGDLARAEDVLGRALAASKARETRLSILGNMGILYLKKRDARRARECFEKVLELDPNEKRARAALDRLSRPPAGEGERR